MKTSPFFQTKNLFVIVCCFASMASIKSQTFNILPSNTKTMTLICSTIMQPDTIFISNPTLNDISLSYTIISNTLPMQNDINGAGGCWDYQFCDWYKCLPFLPSDTMNPSLSIPATSQSSSMILDIITYTNKGQGSYILKLFETNNPSNSQIVTWNVTGCAAGNECTAGISESVSKTNFILYPNPAGDFVNMEITKGYTNNGSIQVYDLAGEKLLELNGIKSSVQKIDLQSLAAGTYFIKYKSVEGVSDRKIFKTK